MGLFDGKNEITETGSSAEIAKLLKLPGDGSPGLRRKVRGSAGGGVSASSHLRFRICRWLASFLTGSPARIITGCLKKPLKPAAKRRFWVGLPREPIAI